jgi:hypothetical protein
VYGLDQKPTADLGARCLLLIVFAFSAVSAQQTQES